MNVSLVKNKTPRKAREGALISFLKTMPLLQFLLCNFCVYFSQNTKRCHSLRVATQQKKMFQLVL